MDNLPKTKQELDQAIQQGIETYMRNKQFNLSKIQAHEHNGVDTVFISAVNLPTGTPVKLGLGAIASISNSTVASLGSVNEQFQTSIVTGNDLLGAIVGTTTKNMQFNFLHQPQNPSNQSFITAARPPLFNSVANSTITVSSGGNTISTNDYNFTINALAGALINIFNSAGTLVETQTIASNTSSVITITGTWGATTTGGTYNVFQPVFFGSANTPYQRFYTCEGTGAGVRFGVGPTNAGQNGLLYMDATGDLYWRGKGGASTKLN